MQLDSREMVRLTAADTALVRAAESAARCDFHLASRLYAHAATRRVGPDAVAAELGVDLPRFYRLCLCRQPKTFVDLQRIADRFGLVLATLAHIAYD